MTWTFHFLNWNLVCDMNILFFLIGTLSMTWTSQWTFNFFVNFPLCFYINFYCFTCIFLINLLKLFCFKFIQWNTRKYICSSLNKQYPSLSAIIMELFSCFTDYKDMYKWSLERQVMILEAIRQKQIILNNLKIYITSKPLLKLGCQFVSIVKVQ